MPLVEKILLSVPITADDEKYVLCGFVQRMRGEDGPVNVVRPVCALSNWYPGHSVFAGPQLLQEGEIVAVAVIIAVAVGVIITVGTGVVATGGGVAVSTGLREIPQAVSSFANKNGVDQSETGL
ncbi:MAG: hypothetical protein HC853_12805 [Anaerolineae bacterium]|nr:hypothetical protein [Anaerolineae bacterium]